MSRSFLIAVSGFALLAACTDNDDVDARTQDDAALERSDNLLDDDEALQNDAADVDGYLDAETPVTDDLDSYQTDIPGSDETLSDDMTGDDGSLLDNEAAEDDVMADSRMSDFNTDFAGSWGSEQQCSSGSTWAISESLISTPTNIVCTVSSIDEGAGQAEVTAICTGEDADGEMMEESEQTFSLAAQDDGTITINHRAEETLQRCM
tara:strand:+ start:482 stop:1102 length:621 start_codon:yes stop_codon:yes gene_type:complete